VWSTANNKGSILPVVAWQEHPPTVIRGPRRPQVSIEEFLCDKRSSTSVGATNTIARSQRSSPISSAPSDGVYTPDVKASLLSRFTPPRLVQHPHDDVVWPGGARSLRRRSEKDIYGPWRRASNESWKSFEPRLIRVFYCAEIRFLRRGGRMSWVRAPTRHGLEREWLLAWGHLTAKGEITCGRVTADARVRPFSTRLRERKLGRGWELLGRKWVKWRPNSLFLFPFLFSSLISNPSLIMNFKHILDASIINLSMAMQVLYIYLF
jgi:hypothetical protein